MRRFAGIVGLIVFALAILASVTLLVAQERAQSHDHAETSFGIMAGDIPPCAWDVALAQRVLSENTSQTIVVNASNTMDVECQSALKLLAPGFDISPRSDEQLISAAAHGRGSAAWIVTPDEVGEYELAITDGIDTRVMGVTVTNLLGLTAVQIQVLAVVGSILGPMLSIPWWLERAQLRKKASPEAPTGTTPSSP